MANFIKANTEYMGINTTSGADSTTLPAVAGKDYYVANLGTGGNLLTVNYGASSVNLSDFEAVTVFYGGTNWVVGSILAGAGGDIRYSTTADYDTGTIVWYVDGFYECIQDGQGQQPDTSPLYWENVEYKASLVSIVDTGGTNAI